MATSSTLPRPIIAVVGALAVTAGVLVAQNLTGQAAATVGDKCPNSTTTQTISGHGLASQIYNGTNTTLDFNANGATFVQPFTGASEKPIEVRTGDHICMIGPSGDKAAGVAGIQGETPRNLEWWDMKCPGCSQAQAIDTYASDTSIWDLRADNIDVDAIQAKNGPLHLHSSYLTYIRDDCVYNGGRNNDIDIDDTLAECHTGISWRIGRDDKAGPPFNLNFTNSLWYIQPQPSGGSQDCTFNGGNHSVSNGKANAGMWKMDNYKGDPQHIHVHNVIIRQDLPNHENCTEAWASGDYQNVTLVWTGPGPYPSALPPGVTVTTNVDVWNNAVTDWLICHGYQQGNLIPGTGFDTCGPQSGPGVSTGAATVTGTTTATIAGSVNPKGKATTYRFDYGTTIGYGSQTDQASAGAGSTSVPVTANLTGLTAGTTYHYRVKATNADGNAFGADGTFTTQAAPPVVPAVTLTAASGVGATTATTNGTVNPNGAATTYKFEYGTTTAYGSQSTPTSAGSGSSAVAEHADLTGLSTTTLYHYRLSATNSAGTAVTPDQTFTTGSSPPPQDPPVVALTATTGVTQTAATVNGTVNPKSAATTYHFDYGTTNAYGSTTSTTSAGSGGSAVPVTAAVGTLAPNTTYHFRLVASNSGGTSATADMTFTTLPGQAQPVVAADPVSDITQTTATLNGRVNPNGAGTVYHWDYGTSGSYGTSTSSVDIGADTTDIPVTAGITGLTANTVYHYRLVATNSGGTTAGADQTFTTGAVNPAPTVTVTSVDQISATSAVIHGTVNPHGVSTSFQVAYGLTNTYGNVTPVQDAGSGSSAVPITVTLNSLAPETEYRYTLTATNTSGQNYTPDDSFLTLPVNPPPASVTFVRQAGNSTTSGDTNKVNISSTAGDTLVATVALHGQQTHINSIKDTAGNSWQQANLSQDGFSNVEVWWTTNAAHVNNVTATVNAAQHQVAMSVSEYSGLGTATLDTFTDNVLNPKGTILGSGLLESSGAANELFVGAASYADDRITATHSPSDGFVPLTEVVAADSDASRHLLSAYRIVSVGDGVSREAAWTLSDEKQGVGTGLILRAASQPPPPSGPLFVQEGTGISNGAATAVTSLPAKSVKGDLLVAVISSHRDQHAVDGVTDDAGNTWVQADQNSNAYANVEVWYAAQAKATKKVTAALNASVHSGVLLLDYTNVGSVSVSAVGKKDNTSTVTHTTTSATVSSLNRLVIAAASYGDAAVDAVEGADGFTPALQVTSGTGVNAQNALASWLLPSVTGSYQASWTLTSAKNGAAMIVSFAV